MADNVPQIIVSWHYMGLLVRREAFQRILESESK